MTESRVDRLLRLAEEAVMEGDYDDKAYHLIGIAQTALEVRRQEAEEIAAMMKAPAGD